jgi:hypothetical protein
MIHIANHPGMNKRPVEAVVVRRQSHPIIAKLPIYYYDHHHHHHHYYTTTTTTTTKTTTALTFLHRIIKVPGSKLGSETGYPD